MVEKSHIIKAAKLWELPIFSNPCPSANTTKRTTLLENLNSFCKDSKNGKRNVYQGLIRWQYEKHKVPKEQVLDLKEYVEKYGNCNKNYSK